MKGFSGERVKDSRKSFLSKSKIGQLHEEHGESSSGSCMAVDEVMFEIAPVNPTLPEGLWQTPNEERSTDQMAWWGKPFIVTTANPNFPRGIRYDVYCLDGESWNHPTLWGMFSTLEEAVERAKSGPPWGKPVLLQS
jgi:hypothetical protein